MAVAAPGEGVASMAAGATPLWKTGNMHEVLAKLEDSGSIFFHKLLGRSHNCKAGQCVQLAVPVWFINEHAEKFEEWANLRTRSSSKLWRVRLSVFQKPNGSPQVQFYGGWKEFVVDNCLQEGDSLVFVLNVDARSEFQVYIFLGTGKPSSKSRAPARKRPNNSKLGARISDQTTKNSYPGRYNLPSAFAGSISTTEELLGGMKKNLASQERQQDLKYNCSLSSEDALYCPEILRDSKGKGFTSQHPGTNSLPSFRRRLTAHNHTQGCIEVPARFVRAHGMQLNDVVELQGTFQESPVRIVTRRWGKHCNQARLYLRTGWKTFVTENGLSMGQEIQFTLTSDSFFVVRVV